MKKISVDKDVCIACGACYAQASDVFTSDTDGTSKVIKEFIEDSDSYTIGVAEGCPTGAIKIEEASDKDCSCETCECKDCNCKDE